MARVQLALNVSNLDDAVAFYTTYFRCAPAKVRPGYANFSISDPPLKLVLIEGQGVPGSINHLGVEVDTSSEVVAAASRLADAGVATDFEEGTTCCYAVQDKVWVTGPDDSRWETYTVLSDAPGDQLAPQDETSSSDCCSAAMVPPVPESACC